MARPNAKAINNIVGTFRSLRRYEPSTLTLPGLPLPDICLNSELNVAYAVATLLRDSTIVMDVLQPESTQCPSTILSLSLSKLTPRRVRLILRSLTDSLPKCEEEEFDTDVIYAIRQFQAR